MRGSAPLRRRALRRPVGIPTRAVLLLAAALACAFGCARDPDRVAEADPRHSEAPPHPRLAAVATPQPSAHTVATALSQAPDLPTQVDAAALFEDERAQRLWRSWRAGEFRAAHELATSLVGAPPPAGQAAPEPPLPDRDRVRVTALTVQLAFSRGASEQSVAAARSLLRDPFWAPFATRFLAQRADVARDAEAVLALVEGREAPLLAVFRARALRRTGRLDDARREIRSVLAEVVGRPHARDQALWRRASIEALRIAADRGDEDAAVAHARALLAFAVKRPEAEEAWRWLLGRAPDAADAAWRQRLEERPQDDVAILQAVVYGTERRRYKRMVPTLQALAEHPKASPAVRCAAWSWLARARDRRAGLEDAIAALEQVAEQCPAGLRGVHTGPRAPTNALGPGLRDEDRVDTAMTTWRLARLRVLRGEDAGLEAALRALDQGLDGRAARDARLLLAIAGGRAERLAAIAEHAPKAARDYAEIDVVDEVVWRLAFDALQARRWPEARLICDALRRGIDDGPRPGDAGFDPARYDDRFWARGRAAYFAGVALWHQGRRDEARARWRRLAVRHPLSWFATLSISRLGATPPAQGDAARQAGPDREAVTEAQRPPIAAARLLGLLGWHQDAGALLDAAGLAPTLAPADRWLPGDPRGIWTRASLDAEAGRYVAAHHVGRDTSRWFEAVGLHPGTADAWRLAFPRAFAPLVHQAAERFELDPALLWAVMRTESGFDPRVESYAHAIGLMQLILPTAEAMAKPLGLQATEETLREPDINVPLGARYLRRLFNRYGHYAHVAAGYNAGGGAVGRWRNERGDWPVDLFVEAIPFRQTREYVKRVLHATAVYRQLDGGAPTRWALQQPAEGRYGTHRAGGRAAAAGHGAR